jgi:hypothetical protein
MKTGPKPKPPEHRFWTKVDRTRGLGPRGECWEWTGKRNRSNYGDFAVVTYPKTKNQFAHRFSWELHNGPITDDKWVLHECDNPPCVNPDHLFLGTAQDNWNDCKAKGRSNRGSRHGNAKLSEAQASFIKRAAADGVRECEIASWFDMTPSGVHHVLNGGWGHVAADDCSVERALWT